MKTYRQNIHTHTHKIKKQSPKKKCSLEKSVVHSSVAEWSLEDLTGLFPVEIPVLCWGGGVFVAGSWGFWGCAGAGGAASLGE